MSDTMKRWVEKHWQDAQTSVDWDESNGRFDVGFGDQWLNLMKPDELRTLANLLNAALEEHETSGLVEKAKVEP